ncbi:MAG: nuclear transport factor 2 family protein [Bacteroidota bacterium]
MKEIRKSIIENYIAAYNGFDVEGMLKDLDEQVVFENYSDGQLNMQLQGSEAFRQQAESATAYFKTREQKVTNWIFSDDLIEVELLYTAVLAMDFPNGLKAGEQIQMKGLSVFTFRGDKLVKIVDKS